MAPVKVCNFVLPTKDKLKIRKPLVEKMRRDRINSSIEQLKALLKKELQGQQPSSKLEKADILETAVFYLKENTRPAAGGRPAPGPSYAEGFTRCLEETLGFLSAQNQSTASQQKVAHHFRVPPPRGVVKVAHHFRVPPPRGVVCAGRVVNDRNSAPKCVRAGGRQPLWRPW